MDPIIKKRAEKLARDMQIYSQRLINLALDLETYNTKTEIEEELKKDDRHRQDPTDTTERI